MATLKERTEAGAAALDAYFHSRTWDKEIDLDTLDLSSTCDCVLGQVFDDGYDGYYEGIRRLGIEDSSAFGFDTDAPVISERQYKNLTRAWIDLIRERIARRTRRRAR